MAKIDTPKKKKETLPTKGGSAAVVKRNPKTKKLEATLAPDFGGVTQSTMKSDSKTRASTGNRSFTGAPAPRGGKQAPITKSGNVKGGTKAQLKSSKKRVNKVQASAQAKKSAKRLY